MDKLSSLTASLMNFVDDRAVVRRLSLLFTLYMTWYGVHEAWVFATRSTFDGVGTAAVIAAVLVPVSGLQGFAFSAYAKSKSRGE